VILCMRLNNSLGLLRILSSPLTTCGWKIIDGLFTKDKIKRFVLNSIYMYATLNYQWLLCERHFCCQISAKFLIQLKNKSCFNICVLNTLKLKQLPIQLNTAYKTKKSAYRKLICQSLM
jgi:hypothetical protein